MPFLPLENALGARLCLAEIALLWASSREREAGRVASAGLRERVR